MRVLGVCAWAVCACLMGWFPAGVGADESQHVAAELKELHDWLGADENAVNWRDYLKSEELQEEISRGPRARLEKVAQILAIYAGIPDSKRREPFAEVQQALDAWLEELTVARPEELANITRASKMKFSGVPASPVEEASRQLSQALANLDAFLVSGGETRRSNWRQYLRWEQLEAQQQLDSPNYAALEEILTRISANETGLELEPFREARRALRNYIRTRQAVPQADTQEKFDERLEELAKQLEKYRERADLAAGASIGDTIQWLETTNQLPLLVSTIRKYYWKPNLYADVSEEVVAAGIEDTVTRSTLVNEQMAGAQIRGVATLYGRLGVDLLPDAEHASLNIQLLGQAVSDNTAYAGPVSVFSSGVTYVNAAKRVVVDEQGLSDLPAVASANTRTSIDGVSARSCLVRRIATRKAHASQGQAQYMASRKAEVQIAQQMDVQADELLAKANESFQEKFRKPLLRRDEFPRVLRFRTTEDRLQVEGLQVNSSQLAAPDLPPSFPARYDLAVQVHETLISNFSEALVGGLTLTDERLAELMNELTGDVPEELRIGPDKDPWSITFAEDRPVSAEFNGEQVKLTVRGRRFTRQDQQIRDAIDISALYQVVRSAEGAKLVREGEVQVDFLNRRRLGLPQLTFKTFIRVKFEALFKPEFASDGLELPGRWERLGRLPLRHVRADGGWLAVAWSRASEKAPATTAALDPARDPARDSTALAVQ